MNNENPFDEKSNNHIRSEMIENFTEEFRPKSHFEDFLIVYRSGQFTRTILQFLSLLTAATLVAYPSKYFFGTWLYGIPFALTILFVLELAKRKTSDIALRKYFKKNKLSVMLVVSLIFLSSGSIALSVFGTPILVSEFVPAPDLISVASIREEADLKRAETTSFWQSQIDSAKSSAASTFDEGNWLGKISGKTKVQKYQFDTKANDGQDSLNKYLAIIDARLQKEVGKAEKENDLIVNKADNQNANVGFYTAIGCGCLEVLFYLISFFLVRFRFISSLQLSEGDQPTGPAPTGGNKGSRKKETKETVSKSETVLNDVSKQFGNNSIFLNETETKNRKQETEQKQPVEEQVRIEISEEYRNETRNKTFILNKDVNHGTPTVDKSGNKVLYYIANKDKKKESVKYYTPKQVDKMVNAYSRRLSEAKEKNNQKSIRTNSEGLKIWKNFQLKLKDYKPEVV